MSNKKGWVKFHRKTLDNPIVCKDSDYFAVWGYMMLLATHDGLDAEFNGNRIVLKPGQFITGRKSISSFLSVSESKVQRILKRYESEQQIEQQKSNRNRLITMLNWDGYQESEQQIEQPVNNQRTTSEQPVNTNKNVRRKECNNERSSLESKDSCYLSESNNDFKPSKNKRFDSKLYSMVISQYHEFCEGLPGVKVLSDPLKKQIKSRINEDPEERKKPEYWRDLFCMIHASDFLMGRTKDWKASLHWILKPTNFSKILNGNYSKRSSSQKTKNDYDRVAELWGIPQEKEDNQDIEIIPRGE